MPDPGEGAHQAAAREAAEEATRTEARDQAREQVVARLTGLPDDRQGKGPNRK